MKLYQWPIKNIIYKLYILFFINFNLVIRLWRLNTRYAAESGKFQKFPGGAERVLLRIRVFFYFWVFLLFVECLVGFQNYWFDFYFHFPLPFFGVGFLGLYLKIKYWCCAWSQLEVLWLLQRVVTFMPMFLAFLSFPFHESFYSPPFPLSSNLTQILHNIYFHQNLFYIPFLYII